MSKDTKPKEELPPELKIIAQLIRESEWSNIFSSGFSLETFTKKAELRGLTGSLWNDTMLQMIMRRYRRQVTDEGIPEDKADIPVQNMATKLGLDLNQLRRLLYGIDLKGNPLLTEAKQVAEKVTQTIEEAEKLVSNKVEEEEE